MSKLLPNGLRRFLRNSEGSATVESVLWLPVFFALFGLMTDAAMIFNGHSRVMRVIQDGNRNFSTGRFSNTDETEAWIIAELSGLSNNITVVTEELSGVATTTAFVPARDLEILGMFSALNEMTISITSQHYIEY